jgi:4a-hydroxytetrahydrobiopterin dehydratase
MSDLSSMECVPCRGGVPPLVGDELKGWHEKLANEWQLIEGHHISKLFEFSSFVKSIEFTNAMADLSESVGHHPVILINFKKVTVDVWTHKIDGLTDADFIFAAKIDEINIS